MHIISCRGTDNLLRDISQLATVVGLVNCFKQCHWLTRHHHNCHVLLQEIPGYPGYHAIHRRTMALSLAQVYHTM